MKNFLTALTAAIVVFFLSLLVLKIGFKNDDVFLFSTPWAVIASISTFFVIWLMEGMHK